MADQPLKSDELIDPKFLVDAIIKANEFLAVNKELQTVLKENLSVTQKSISTTKVNNSEDLKQQALLTKQAAMELQNLEVLKKSAAQTEIALANVRIANNKALSQELKTEADFAKALKNEGQQIQQITSVYDVLRKKYNDLSRAQIELSLRGKENGVVFRGIKDEAVLLRAELDKAEQGAGRFQRNVGNYKSGFDGLGNSVNQLTREFPAFTNSVQTGFLAISNNLPIFFDQIAKIRKENAALAADGKQTTSVLSQLGTAVFSFGSILSIGVTLLTLYGKEFVEFVGELFEGEKALKSITEANDIYNQSINTTREQINNLKIDLKVQTGLLSKFQGDQLKNEGDRIKDLNAEKKLRTERVAALQKELGLTKDLKLESNLINNSLKQLSQGAFDAKQLNALERYNNELAKINKVSRIDVEAINERYNLEGKLNKTKKDGASFREKITTEELITQKHALDQIEQLRINAIKDDEEREKEQAVFNNEQAVKEIDLANDIAANKTRITTDNYNAEKVQLIANSKNTKEGKKQLNEDLLKLDTDYEKKYYKILTENIPEAEQAELRLRLAENLNNELLGIEDKYQTKRDEKAAERAAKNNTAREGLRKETADFEIHELENDFNKKEQKLSIFNLRELNQQEQVISAKKVVEIQAEADRKKLLTDNYNERLEIQKKADDDIVKESERSEAVKQANNKKVLNQALQFEQQIIDSVAKAEKQKSDLRIAAFDKQIANEDKNIETQRKLAERGKKNTLADEEANKVKLELQKQEEQKQEIKRQKILAFFKLFSSYAEKNPDTALVNAARDTALAEAVSAAFIDGTENVGKDAQFTGNKFKNGQDGYVARFDGDERILNPEQNKKVGDLSNESLADLAYRSRNGLLDTVKYTAIPTNDFAKNIQESALLMETIALNRRMESLEQTIKDKPVSQYTFTGYEFITKEIQNGMIKVARQKLKRPNL